MVGNLRAAVVGVKQPKRWIPKGGVLLAIVLAFFTFRSNAAVRFDVFLGYDGVVPEASWFPITCEINNDGPSFKGIVEITPDYGGGQTRREVVELPTGTLKRIRSEERRVGKECTIQCR